MQIKELGEFGLIRHITEKLPLPPGEVIIGAGDDTAAVRWRKDTISLVTTDMLVEGVDFDLKYAGAGGIGHKALAVNLSDIAAMGGTAHYALVALALPGHTELDWVDELYTGMLALANEHKVCILGGDISAAPQVVISITVIGEQKERIISRSGATPGDIIMVTGDLGAAAAGLGLLQRYGRAFDPHFAGLIQRQLRPDPRLAEGVIAARNGATAMIDLSDGIASDLGHICRMSRVGAEIWWDKLPVSALTLEAARDLGCSPEDLVLKGGEDFELLFTLPPSKHDAMMAAFKRHKLAPPARIGQIIQPENGVCLYNMQGEKVPLRGGFEHFVVT